MEPGNGCVDRLSKFIYKGKFDFKKKQLGKFDYRMLMDNPETEVTVDDSELLKKYYELASTADGRVVVDEDGSNNYNFVFSDIRNELLKIDPDVCHLTDVLVKQTFSIKKSKHKVVLWSCFGEEIYNNIIRNIPNNTIMCERCGKRIIRDGPHRIYCDECNVELEREKCRAYYWRNKAKNHPI